MLVLPWHKDGWVNLGQSFSALERRLWQTTFENCMHWWFRHLPGSKTDLQASPLNKKTLFIHYPFQLFSVFSNFYKLQSNHAPYKQHPKLPGRTVEYKCNK